MRFQKVWIYKVFDLDDYKCIVEDTNESWFVSYFLQNILFLMFIYAPFLLYFFESVCPEIKSTLIMVFTIS